MKKEFVLYNEASALKELGFDEPCFGYYHNKYLSIYWADADEMENLPISQKGNALCDYECLAPTYSQAFRWFREKYKIDYNIIRIGGGNDETGHYKTYGYSIYGLSDNSNQKLRFRTYEETELACLIKLIEIVKNK